MEKYEERIRCGNQGICDLVKDKKEKPIKKIRTSNGLKTYLCKHEQCSIIENLNNIAKY